MANKIQLRRDTSANWTRVNPILADGEPGVDITNKKIKYGDGSTAWRDLPYASGAATPTGDPTQLVNGAYELTLQANGMVTFPNGSSFNGYDIIASNNSYIEFGSSNFNTWMGVDSNTAFIQTDYNENNYIWTFNAAGEMLLPSPGKILNGSYNWTFGTNGTLTLPGEIRSVANIGDVTVTASDVANSFTWTFAGNGGIRTPILTAAPDTPIAGTYYTADGVTWDPAAKVGSVPYPVFYDGVAYQALY